MIVIDADGEHPHPIVLVDQPRFIEVKRQVMADRRSGEGRLDRAADRHRGQLHRPKGGERPGDELRRSRRSVYRSEEHTSELPSLMRISYAVFCLKKKNILRKN